ncbi:prephenate dehydrogenase [Paracoccus laeviglucosivorans]|uniref:Prephenate dehydrogenase n=1 Tax=Paracoccus laeviglucosivorans TaxID=1197861 RepID=A0A521CLK5_9RHOB|nr:prephenate dehydrogenase [Paracoccus laeviglucosivorans]SMO60304.1 prephenate dehydrogenase [Paracoccus laeviglucosivorans]
MLEKPLVTIVGFGAFGQLLAGLLTPYCRIQVHDPDMGAQLAATNAGHGTVPVAGIGGQYVILAVPVQGLADCLRQIAPHLRPGQTVIDVCSVKEEPARLMADLLPAGVDVIATHPMFGPQSAVAGLAGLQVVLCPVRGDGWRRLAAWLRRAGLRIVVTTPEEHDRQAAMTQGLTHLLARAIHSLGEQPRIRTRSYDLLTEAVAMVLHDAPDVVDAITRRNPHIEGLRVRLMQALAR